MVEITSGGYCSQHGYYWSPTCLQCSNPYRVVSVPIVTSGTTIKSEAPKEQPAGSPAFHALLDELRDLHERKNAGYAGHSADPFANFRQCEAFGIKATDGVITRLSDKWSRLQALWADAGNEQVGESIRDTLLDMSAYALILICLLEETDN